MKDAQKPDHVSLNTLIGRLREGRFVIPDFQREFEWKPWDIRELMRSIFLDYYIGSLLLWTGKKENFVALSCEAIYGFNGDARPEYIVLDGQQRLTALYYAFLAPDIALPTRANRYFYFVRVNRFMAEEYDAAFEYVLEDLSGRLTAEFGRGFDVRNLRYMRQFYLAFPIHHALGDESETAGKRNAPRSESSVPAKRNALRSKFPNAAKRDALGLESGQLNVPPSLRPELSWTHYRLLLGVDDPQAREWYLREAADQHWSTRKSRR